MAYATYEGAVSTPFSSSGTSHVANLPATVDAGDLLVAVCAYYLSDAGAQTPDGWTPIVNPTNGSASVTGAVYLRVADGTEDGGTVDFATTNSRTGVVRILRYSGWFGSLAGVEVSTVITGTGTGPNVGALSPSWGSAEQAWLWFCCAGDDDQNITGAPSGYGNLLSTVSGAGINAGCSVGTATLFTTAATENPATGAIQSSEAFVAGLLAIRPVAAPTSLLKAGRALDDSATANNATAAVPAVGEEAAFAVVGRFRCPDNAAGSDNVGLYGEAGSGSNLLTVQLKQSGAINFFYRNAAGTSIDITSSAGFDDGADHTWLAVKRASNDYELFIDGTSEGTATTDISTPPDLTHCVVRNGSASAAGGMWGPVWAFRSAITWAQVVELLANGEIEGVSSEAEWYPALATTTTSVIPERRGNTAYDLTPSAASAFTAGPAMEGFAVQAGDVPAGKLLALGTDLYNSDGTAFASSDDDGATWANGTTVPGTNFEALYGGMAAQASTVHILLPQSNPGSNPVTTQHRRSTDGGANWSSATTLQNDTPANAQLRRVQMDAGNGTVHVSGLEKSDGSGGTTWYLRSEDAGATWDDGVEVAIAECQAVAYDPSDTHVYIAGHDTQDSGVIKVVVSTDGGDTFGSPVTLSGTQNGGRPRAVAAGGHVVVAWQDEDGLEDVYVCISANGGTSWSSPIVAMDATTLGIDRYNHFDIAIYGSVVHVAALSNDSPSGGPVHYAYSLDYGATWSTPEVIHGGSTEGPVWQMAADADWVHITTGLDKYIRRTAPVAPAGEVALDGSLASVSALAGDLSAARPLSGSLASASALSGSLSVVRPLTGAAAAVTALSADASVARALTGSLAAASALSGELSLTAGLTGALASASTLSGSLSVARSFAGNAATTSALAAALSRARGLDGSLAASSEAQAAASVDRALAGALSSTSALSGELGVSGELALTGSLASTSTLAGALSVERPLTGALSSTSALAGDLSTGTEVALDGSLTAVSVFSGSLSVERSMAGTVTSVSTFAGAFVVARGLSGTVPATSSLSAALVVLRALSGTLVAASDMAGELDAGEPPGVAPSLTPPLTLIWTDPARGLDWSDPGRRMDWTHPDRSLTWENP